MSLHADLELDVIDPADLDETPDDTPRRPLPRVLPEPLGIGTRHYPGEFLG